MTMALHPDSLSEPQNARRDRARALAPIAFLATLYAAGHILFLTFLPRTAERFMLGDRAGERLEKLERLLAAPDLDRVLAVLFREVSPGDYALFAPAYALGGPQGVILQSILLFTLALIAVHRIGSAFGPRVGLYAAIGYALLPATLFHPHAFVSEAIANPFVIFTTFFLVRVLAAEAPARGDWIGLSLTLAVAAFTRNVFALLPLLVFAALAIGLKRREGALRRAFLTALAGFSLLGLWGAMVGVGQHRYEIGESLGGLNSNLYLRTERIAALAGFPMPEAIEARRRAHDRELGTVTPNEFLGLARAHPGVTVRTFLSDFGNIVVNPGVAMAYGRFLGLFTLGESGVQDLGRWREARDKGGALGLVRLVWETSPVGFAFNVVGGLLWAATLALAVHGAWRLLVHPTVGAGVKLWLLMLPAYALGATTLLAGYTRWDHRSPVEFAIVLLAAISLAALTAGRSGAPSPRRATRSSESR